MHMLKKSRRSIRQDCQGAVTVEMAFITVSVMVLLPFIADTASVISSSMALSGGLRAGQQLALTQPSNTSGITETIRQASGFSSATVTPSEFCECDGTVSTCGALCVGGGSPHRYLTI